MTASSKLLPSGPLFLRGDCNSDGELRGVVTDAVFLLNTATPDLVHRVLRDGKLLLDLGWG